MVKNHSRKAKNRSAGVKYTEANRMPARQCGHGSCKNSTKNPSGMCHVHDNMIPHKLSQGANGGGKMLPTIPSLKSSPQDEAIPLKDVTPSDPADKFTRVADELGVDISLMPRDDVFDRYTVSRSQMKVGRDPLKRDSVDVLTIRSHSDPDMYASLIAERNYNPNQPIDWQEPEIPFEPVVIMFIDRDGYNDGNHCIDTYRGGGLANIGGPSINVNKSGGLAYDSIWSSYRDVNSEWEDIDTAESVEMLEEEADASSDNPDDFDLGAVLDHDPIYMTKSAQSAERALLRSIQNDPEVMNWIRENGTDFDG